MRTFFFTIFILMILSALIGGNVFLFSEKRKIEFRLSQEKLLVERQEKELEEIEDAREKVEGERDSLRASSMLYLTVNNDLEKEVKALKNDLKKIEDSRAEAERLKALVAEKEKRIAELAELSTPPPAGVMPKALAAKHKALVAKKEREFKLEKEKLGGEKKALTAQKELLGREKIKLVEEVNYLNKEISSLEDTLREERSLYHYNLGVAYAKAGIFDAAIAAYEKSLETDPDNADTYYNLGLLAAEVKEDLLTAAFYYRKYLKLNPYAEDKTEIQKLIDKHMTSAF